MGGEVRAFPTTYLLFRRLNKVVFFNPGDFVFMRWEDGLVSYYGTLDKFMGEEFLNLPQNFDLNIERALYYRLISIGIVRSIAGLFPVSEVDN